MTNHRITETWKPVVGFEGLYEISDFGRIKSLDRMIQRRGHTKLLRGRLLTSSVNGAGHLQINLSNENKKSFKVHRLVLEAFTGPCPQGLECCHNDGNHVNNHIENLRWDTRSSNIMDRVDHGVSNRGERQGSSKLTEDQVHQIRTLCKHSDIPQREIGGMYGVNQQTVSKIHTRIRWAWLE